MRSINLLPGELYYTGRLKKRTRQMLIVSTATVCVLFVCQMVVRNRHTAAWAHAQALTQVVADFDADVVQTAVRLRTYQRQLDALAVDLRRIMPQHRCFAWSAYVLQGRPVGADIAALEYSGGTIRIGGAAAQMHTVEAHRVQMVAMGDVFSDVRPGQITYVVGDDLRYEIVMRVPQMP